MYKVKFIIEGEEKSAQVLASSAQEAKTIVQETYYPSAIVSVKCETIEMGGWC